MPGFRCTKNVSDLTLRAFLRKFSSKHHEAFYQVQSAANITSRCFILIKFLVQQLCKESDSFTFLYKISTIDL